MNGRPAGGAAPGAGGGGGEVGGFLGEQLGTSDPAAGCLAFRGTTIGIVVSVFAVRTVLAGRQAESTGLKVRSGED